MVSLSLTVHLRENNNKSHKKVFQRKTSACRDGTLKNQPNKMRTTPQHTPSLHLVPFCQLCFVLVSCVHRRVVEGSGEGSGGCVVHVDVHGECVTLWVAAM